MGAGVMDYMELSHEIELHTGGLNASTHVCTDPVDLYGFDQVWVVVAVNFSISYHKYINFYFMAVNIFVLIEKDRVVSMLIFSDISTLSLGLCQLPKNPYN